MKRIFWFAPCVLIPFTSAAAAPLPSDEIPTSVGLVKITFVGHASLILTHGETVIHIDPFGQLADYATLPKADLVLITHEHFDHLDQQALAKIRTEKTVIVAPPVCAGALKNVVVLRNGEKTTQCGILIEAVPAYNITHERAPGKPFHPRGVGNGYVLNFGATRIYVAGDTENIPEMKALAPITVAFLPMNLPYTMTPEMVADAARAFKPKILYPYHYGDTDPTRLSKLLKDSGIEVRIRPLR